MVVQARLRPLFGVAMGRGLRLLVAAEAELLIAERLGNLPITQQPELPYLV
jgi:hypothetical protein